MFHISLLIRIISNGSEMRGTQLCGPQELDHTVNMQAVKDEYKQRRVSAFSKRVDETHVSSQHVLRQRQISVELLIKQNNSSVISANISGLHGRGRGC